MLFNIIVSFIHCYEFDAIGNKRSSPDFDDADFDNDPLGKKVINISALFNFSVFDFVKNLIHKLQCCFIF
jgi:hypothetical protein